MVILLLVFCSKHKKYTGGNMNIYGFCNEPARMTVRSFLQDNLIGFGTMNGLKASQICFELIPADEDYDLLVSRRHKHPDHRMFISLNQRIVDDIEESSPDIIMYYLWDIMTKCLRLWWTDSDNLNLDSLVPPHALYESGRESVCKNLCDLYVAKNWTTAQLRRQFDASFVAMNVADTVTAKNNLEQDMDELNIAKRIFFMQRSNWKSFLPA